MPDARIGAKARSAAMVALPSLSVVVAALVFLGPGARAATLGARVYGGPAEGASRVAVRVELSRSLYDVLDNAGAHEILVEGSAPGQTLRAWHGFTGDDGVAEASLEASAPLHGSLALAVSTLGPKARTVAAGEIRLRPRTALAPSGTRVNGVSQGDLTLEVEVPRGVMAAPFPERLRVRVTPPGATDLEVTGLGADVPDVSAGKVTTDATGAASIEVRPLAHQVELTVKARADGKSGRWEATLPVVPGAMWLRPEDSGSRVRTFVAPGPRARAYVSFWTEDGRIGGGVIALTRSPTGKPFDEAVAPLPPGPFTGPLVATIAGDALELGAGTVAWPLRPAEGAFSPPPLLKLLDGIPAANDREEARARAARRAGLWLIGAAALAEVLLLLAQGRAAQRKLEAHLVQASSDLPVGDQARLLDASREHPVLRGLLAGALVALAFALAAALGTFR